MKFFFIVQGEGRGHMTQAIALSEILRSAGHELVHVVVGKLARRKVPDFFFSGIGADVTTLPSPNFITDRRQKGVKPFRTIVYSIMRSSRYGKSIARLKKMIDDHQPDVIVNFYDFLGGLFNFLHRPDAKFICVAHQFLLDHPDFVFPPGRHVDRRTLLLGNRIARLGAHKVLALSFRPHDHVPTRKLFVVPPLLRDSVSRLTRTSGDHLLVYVVNPGYGAEIENFHKKHPEVPLHCFWDHRDKPDEWRVDDTLTFHQLDDHKFLDKMRSSRGYASTAGFESICEAMYLGKPTMMVPVDGHYEQACNAVDAERAGAGIYHHEFNILKLLEYIPRFKDVSPWFGKWVDSSRATFIEMLT